MAIRRMTAARKAALRKAQLASARKRRRRRVAAGIGISAVALFGIKSTSRYREAKSFHNQVNGEKYSYPTHLRVQATRRKEVRKNFYKAVPRIIKNTPMKTRIGHVNNPWTHRIDAKDGRRLKAKLAWSNLKAGYRNYYS